MSNYPRKHVARFDPNQSESAMISEMALGLTEAELLDLLGRPPVPEDQPTSSMSAANQRILTACKDTISVTRKGKVKEALLLGVFHHLKLHRLMGYTSFDEFAWDYFRKSHTTAYETIDYAKVIVTLAAAGITTFPLKGQALDLLFLGLTQEEQVTVWREALSMGAHEKDTQFVAVLKGSKLIDQTKVEALLRKKAISNGRPASKIENPAQPAEIAKRAHLSEIARTLARPEHAELLSAIEHAAKGRGCSVADFFLEAAREKLERVEERNAAPEPPCSATEALETEASEVSSDPSGPSKRDDTAHAIFPEVKLAIPRQVDKNTENFEELCNQMLDRSHASTCFEKAKRICASGRMRRVQLVGRGKATVLKSSG